MEKKTKNNKITNNGQLNKKINDPNTYPFCWKEKYINIFTCRHELKPVLNSHRHKACISDDDDDYDEHYI